MTLKQPCLSVKGGARCVQRLDDSHSAVRIMYRISLRSSSSREPRYPLPKVVCVNWEGRGGAGPLRTLNFQHGLAPLFVRGYVGCGRGCHEGTPSTVIFSTGSRHFCRGMLVCVRRGGLHCAQRAGTLGRAPAALHGMLCCFTRGNDPSAGSPTETLLRLHLPLNDKV